MPQRGDKRAMTISDVSKPRHSTSEWMVKPAYEKVRQGFEKKKGGDRTEFTGKQWIKEGARPPGPRNSPAATKKHRKSLTSQSQNCRGKGCSMGAGKAEGDSYVEPTLQQTWTIDDKKWIIGETKIGRQRILFTQVSSAG